MKYFKEVVTSAKHVEYHLDHSKNYKILEEELEAIGFEKYKDFKLIFSRGYNMKETIRLQKAKIKKDPLVKVIFEKYLISEKSFNKLSNIEQRYYPMLSELVAQTI